MYLCLRLNHYALLCLLLSLAVVLIDSFDWSVVFFLETPTKILFIIFAPQGFGPEAVSHKLARPEVLFSNLKHGSRSDGSRRFYLNFYSLHSVTGNVGDTENDLSRFGNGIL